jgi:hypothetical protein
MNNDIYSGFKWILVLCCGHDEQLQSGADPLTDLQFQYRQQCRQGRRHRRREGPLNPPTSSEDDMHTAFDCTLFNISRDKTFARFMEDLAHHYSYSSKRSQRYLLKLMLLELLGMNLEEIADVLGDFDPRQEPCTQIRVSLF